MIPLRIDAILDGAVCLPQWPIALDALLMWATAIRDGLPPPASAEECGDIPIPLAERDGVYLASLAEYTVERRGRHDFTNRRMDIGYAQMLSVPSFRRLQINAGPSKSYRIPRERLHLVDDRMTWWAIGDRDGVGELLHDWVTHISKRRAVGIGRVREWRVERCEPWGEGFPVVRDGAPTRPLPLTWPGVDWSLADRAMCALRPPYWAHHRREDCLVPILEA